MTVLTFLKGFSNVKELVSIERKMGTKAKWPAPPPYWLLNRRDGGGAIQWRPPEFFQALKMSYDID